MTDPGEAQLSWASPAADGYRWPAEWEPHAATWLSWPHNPETWPERLPAVETAFAAIVAALAPHERVEILVRDEASEDHVRRWLQERGAPSESALGFHRWPTNDAWIRDCGPIFLLGAHAGDDSEPGPGRALLDFRFDAWGGKYPPWDRDDAVPAAVAAARGLPRYARSFVLEGGSVDGDGRGTVLTTESCLLHANRGARSREAVEAELVATLGARQVLWLGDGIVGDDTDGHVDDIARFVGRHQVVAAVEPDTNDVNHAPLAANLARLRGMRDADGASLDVIELPMPPAWVVDGQRCPASYANFYLANGVVLLPVFEAPSDARAAAILAECLPGREVVPIPARDLVVGLGAVHCLTQQEPARACLGASRGT